jgi:cytochrome c2
MSNHKLAHRTGLVAIACVILLLAACGGAAPAPAPTAVPVEPTAAPADVVARGKAVFTEKVCHSCHTIKGNADAIGLVGPDLTKLYADAPGTLQTKEYKASKGTATTALAYIRESILDPNIFIFPKCPTAACLPNLMIQDFKATIPAGDLDALLAYLVTLR